MLGDIDVAAFSRFCPLMAAVAVEMVFRPSAVVIADVVVSVIQSRIPFGSQLVRVTVAWPSIYGLRNLVVILPFCRRTT